MKFLHYDVTAGPNNVILVELSRAANVMLLDDTSFSAYRRGRRYQYQGGYARRSPVRLAPPHNGRWHVVIDVGGYAGRVEANVSVV